MVGEAAVANLSLLDEPLQLLPRCLDRRRRIRVVELEDVDVIGVQAPKALFDLSPHALRREVADPPAAAVVQRAALGEDIGAVAAVGDRLAYDLFSSSPSVERRRVDPVDSGVQRRMDRSDGRSLVLVAPVDPPGFRRADRRGPHSNRRDEEVTRPELSGWELHRKDPSSVASAEAFVQVTRGYHQKNEVSTNKEGTMPQKAWSSKRERQYEHIKEGLRERGRSEDTAEEIAARTVNKERARSGEARESSRLSRRDISSGRRGGLRSHHGSGGRTG